MKAHHLIALLCIFLLVYRSASAGFFIKKIPQKVPTAFYHTDSLPPGHRPATISNFSVQRLSNSRVFICWHIEPGGNEKGFSLERRNEDETEFRQVAYFKSSDGSGNFLEEFSIVDDNLFSGDSYYRIWQKDDSGTSYYTLIKPARALKDPR